MARLTARLPLPIGLIAALVLLMALVMPVAAAPTSGEATSNGALANHVANCDDITILAGGVISVNGIVLTAAQAALLSADARAALQLAADANANANANVCVDVAASLIPLSATVNAHIVICGTASLTANSATVGGAAIPAALLSAGLREALAIAAAANVNTCLTTTVTTGNLTANVSLDAFVDAQLNSAGDLLVNAGGQSFVLDDVVIVGATGALNANAAVTVCLRIGGALNLATDSQTLTVSVVTGCSAVAPATGTNTAPGGSATGPGSLTGGPGSPMLPDTAMRADAPNAVPILGIVGLLIALAAVHRREVRVR